MSKMTDDEKLKNAMEVCKELFGGTVFGKGKIVGSIMANLSGLLANSEKLDKLREAGFDIDAGHRMRTAIPRDTDQEDTIYRQPAQKKEVIREPSLSEQIQLVKKDLDEIKEFEAEGIDVSKLKSELEEKIKVLTKKENEEQ